MFTKEEVEGAVLGAGKLLRGSVHFRMASILVRTGAGTASTPVLVSILEFYSLNLLHQRLSGFDIALKAAVFLLGIVLIALGLWLFFKQHGQQWPPKIPNSFSVGVPADIPFEAISRSIAKVEGMVVEFENFTPAELQTPLREQALLCDDYLEALLAVRLLAAPPLPAYTLNRAGSTVTLRKKP